MSIHHETTQIAYKAVMQIWNDKIYNNNDEYDGSISSHHAAHHHRCRICWLRKHQCYCHYADAKKLYYSSKMKDTFQHCELIIYYHYLEIGRSANTAHLFQMLCPDITSTLIYGDSEAEAKLFNEIYEELLSGNGLSTCILYPCPEAVYIHDWITEQMKPFINTTSNNSNNNLNTNSNSKCNRKFRIIALDGTYKQVTNVHIHKTVH